MGKQLIGEFRSCAVYLVARMIVERMDRSRPNERILTRVNQAECGAVFLPHYRAVCQRTVCIRA